MLVLRVEHRKQPYEGRPNRSLKAEKDWCKLPSPFDDGFKNANWKHEGWWCATKNYQQFKLWWKPTKLKEVHYARTVILDLPPEKVFECKHQVVINRRRARIVGYLNHKTLKPVWIKELKHSSTTEKEELFRSEKTRTRKPTQSKQSLPTKLDAPKKSSSTQKLMQSSDVVISEKPIESL